MRSKVWKTKDGAKIPIGKLSDEHLENILQFLERKHTQLISAGYGMLCLLQGEMAILDVETGLERLEKDGPSAINELYDDLVEEAVRRKIRRV